MVDVTSALDDEIVTIPIDTMALPQRGPLLSELTHSVYQRALPTMMASPKYSEGKQPLPIISPRIAAAAKKSFEGLHHLKVDKGETMGGSHSVLSRSTMYEGMKKSALLQPSAPRREAEILNLEKEYMHLTILIFLINKRINRKLLEIDTDGVFDNLKSYNLPFGVQWDHWIEHQLRSIIQQKKMSDTQPRAL